MRPWTQKSALIQQRTSLGKGLKNGYSKGRRWLQAGSESHGGSFRIPEFRTETLGIS